MVRVVVDTSNTIVVCPVFELVQNGNVLFVPSGYITYSWTLDGLPIAGNEAFIFFQGDGLYAVTVDAGNGLGLPRGAVVEQDLLVDRHLGSSEREMEENESLISRDRMRR